MYNFLTNVPKWAVAFEQQSILVCTSLRHVASSEWGIRDTSTLVLEDDNTVQWVVGLRNDKEISCCLSALGLCCAS